MKLQYTAQVCTLLQHLVFKSTEDKFQWKSLENGETVALDWKVLLHLLQQEAFKT